MSESVLLTEKNFDSTGGTDDGASKMRSMNNPEEQLNQSQVSADNEVMIAECNLLQDLSPVVI